MERVGMTAKSVLNVGCSFPVDEFYCARKVASWTAIGLSPQSIDGAGRILRRELHPDLAAKFRFPLADACDLPFEDGYPAVVRVPAGLELKLHRAAGYAGRRVGHAFEKPIR
jgi:hypothetical protein